MGSADEIAKAILFLVGGQQPITGMEQYVDGVLVRI